MRNIDAGDFDFHALFIDNYNQKTLTYPKQHLTTKRTRYDDRFGF